MVKEESRKKGRKENFRLRKYMKMNLGYSESGGQGGGRGTTWKLLRIKFRATSEGAGGCHVAWFLARMR